MNHDHPFIAAVSALLHVLKENWALFAAWLGSITLMQVQSLVGIGSAMVVTLYTLWKWRKEAKENKE